MQKTKTHRRARSRTFTTVSTLVMSAAIGSRLSASALIQDKTRYDAALYPIAAAFQSAGLAPNGQNPPAKRFDIPAGALGDVAKEFETVTGLRISLSTSDIRLITSSGIRGVFTADQALKQMLAGTSVTFRFSGAGVVILELRAASESVDVAASLPQSSSPKLTQPLRDTPQTITVIPADVIQAQGATTLRDVLRNVSGITFQAGEGGVPAGDQMTIRGFSARTDMFVDGVRDTGGYSRDPFNLQQLEVTKGPSSSISGRGTTGGAINQVSKTPHLGESRDSSIMLGNADNRRVTLDLNQPLDRVGAPTAAVRLNAMFTDGGVPGRNAVTNKRWGAAPSLALGLGSPTRVTASYMYLGQDNLPEYGLPWVPANTNPELAAYANGVPPVDQSNFYGLRTRDYEKTNTHLGTIDIAHDINSRTTLRNVIRAGRNIRDSVITAPRFVSVNTGTAINRQLQSRDMTDDILSNQTNLTTRFNTGSVRHSIASGLEVSRETSENFARTGPAAPNADLFHPNPNDAYTGPITRTGAFTNGIADSAAAYLFDTVSLTNALEVTAGLRADRFKVNYDSTATTNVVTHLDRTDKILSGRAGVVYKPTPQSSVYLGYGTSSNPSAEGLSLSATTVSLPPERTHNYEAGTKWDARDGRLSLTAAVFRTEKTNARTPGVNAGDPPTVLEGKQRVDGIELGVSGRLAQWWNIFANASFMRSDIAASNTAAEVDANLALTPKRTASIWTTVTLPWDVTAGGGAQYMDAVFRSTANTTSVPSYWILNGTASKPLSRRLTLRANGNNLLDKTYVDRVGGGHFIPGARRSGTLSLDVKW